MKRLARIPVFIGLLLLAAATGPNNPTGEPPSELKAFVEGNTAFALDMYADLAATPGNLFLSPYSVSAAFALVQSGARGPTEAQIGSAFHFPKNRGEVESAFVRLRERLIRIGKSKKVDLSVATGLWAQKDYGFNPEFVELAQRKYEAEVALVDFDAGFTAAARRISEWTSEKTRGKIPVAPNAAGVIPGTRLVVVNTIYFKGKWASRFDKRKSGKKPFWSSPDQHREVMTMRQENPFRYAEVDGARMVELPYVSGDLAMILLLPKRGESVSEFEKRLDAERFADWGRQLSPCSVDLELPRFKMNSDLSLTPMLFRLGVRDAFDRVRADFSGMTTRRPLWITAVQHRAVVEVNEEGTEAAAATQVSFGCSAPAQPPRREFHADRPFVFLIRDNQTGVVLFFGRVVDPSE